MAVGVGRCGKPWLCGAAPVASGRAGEAGNKCLCCLNIALRSMRPWEVSEHACFLESLKHLLDPG